MEFFDPPVGFHFSVIFEMFPQTPNDFRFREVTGLGVEMEMESFKEGGNNRFTYKLPVRTKYDDLVLKRGLFIGSGIIKWCRNALEDFQFQPVNLLVSLLNAQHIPLYNWHVVNAIPKSWKVSNFNAEENSLVVESITLSYQYYDVLFD